MNFLENKIPPPVVLLFFSAAMWGISQFTSHLGLSAALRGSIAMLLVLIGLSFGFAGSRSFKMATTTINPLKPESASSLVTSGIYQHTRNPMYVGLVLLLLAWGIYLASIPALLCIPVFILFLSRFQIAPEERALAELFGAEFDAYKAKVRRWL